MVPRCCLLWTSKELLSTAKEQLECTQHCLMHVLRCTNHFVSKVIKDLSKHFCPKIQALQVTIEIIYSAIQAFVYTLILYSMIGFEWKAYKLWWFFYYIFMFLVYFTLYGMMAVALTPGHQIGVIFLYFFLGFWVLFCGFLIPRKVGMLYY